MSHAAVVARGWGIPAVVGAEAIKKRLETIDGTPIRPPAGDPDDALALLAGCWRPDHS